jgi:hypothetical protein
MANREASAARKLLALGPSTMLGAGLPPDAMTWPRQVQQRLSEAHGTVDLAVRRFYVHDGRPADILEEALSREWDFIALECTSFAATEKTVAYRVRNALGSTAGKWTEARSVDFDALTRDKGRLRRVVYRGGHSVARRTIGTAPRVALDYLIAEYVRAINRLAMVETAAIVVIGTGAASRLAVQNNGSIDRIKLKFNGELSAAAHRKRLGWIDSAAVTREAVNPESMFVDMFHQGQAWHDGIAKRVLEQFAAQG